MRNELNGQNNLGWKGLRSLFSLRNALIVLSIIVVVGAGQRLVAAWFIPAGSIRHQVESALLKWAGLRVVTSGSSELSFWPSPEVTVENVAIYAEGDNNDHPLMTIGKMTGTFSIMSALEGDPVFRTVQIEKPDIFVERDEDGKLNWRGGGILGKVAASPDDAIALLSKAHLGYFTIKQGTAHFRNGKGRLTSVTDLNGNVDMQSLLSSLSFQFTGMVKNHVVKLSGSSDTPAPLIIGNNAPMEMELSSDLASARFDGTVNVGDRPFLSGNLSASTPDTPALSDWLGLRFGAIHPLKALKVNGKLTSEGTKFTISNLTLNMTGASATGVLEMDVGPRQSVPSLSGTLAFDNFDMDAFLSAFMPLPTGLEDMPARLDTAFMHQLQLDLRLSANKATFKSAQFTDMAAGARIKDGHASFILAGSQFDSGSLSGELSLKDDKGETYRLSLQARNIQFLNISKLLGLKGPWPDAKGNLSIDLSSTSPQDGGRRQTSGDIDVKSAAGSLTKFNPSALRSLAGKNQFFDLSELGDGALDFDTFALHARVKNGLAELTDASFKGTQNALSLRGILPYRNNSLALSGTLSNPKDPKAAGVYFFAGGSWPNIVVSPISTFTQKRQ